MGPNMDANNTVNQGLHISVNEDSMDATNAILDAASINPPVDQGASSNENSGGSTNNPIAMLNQEQISRLEKVLQSDEAKTFLGDVLGAGNSSNISDGEMAMMTNIDNSQCIATQGLCPSSNITEQIKQNVQSSTSCNEDIQNSSGESDVEKKRTAK